MLGKRKNAPDERFFPLKFSDLESSLQERINKHKNWRVVLSKDDFLKSFKKGEYETSRLNDLPAPVVDILCVHYGESTLSRKNEKMKKLEEIAAREHLNKKNQPKVQKTNDSTQVEDSKTSKNHVKKSDSVVIDLIDDESTNEDNMIEDEKNDEPEEVSDDVVMEEKSKSRRWVQEEHEILEIGNKIVPINIPIPRVPARKLLTELLESKFIPFDDAFKFIIEGNDIHTTKEFFKHLTLAMRNPKDIVYKDILGIDINNDSDSDKIDENTFISCKTEDDIKQKWIETLESMNIKENSDCTYLFEYEFARVAAKKILHDNHTRVILKSLEKILSLNEEDKLKEIQIIFAVTQYQGWIIHCKSDNGVKNITINTIPLDNIASICKNLSS